MVRRPILCFAILLAACGRQPQVQRVDLDAASNATTLALNPQPDSTGAKWAITASGRGIDFGKPGVAPLLSLRCGISKDRAPPQITVIRHARSEPGAKALFAVLGNGIVARLKLDAALADKEGWRWEGRYPASAPELDVFTGQRDIDATLPGGGELHIAGSGMPREFIEWCRWNGKGPARVAAASSPAPG